MLVFVGKAEFAKVNSREMSGKNSRKSNPAKISSLKVIAHGYQADDIPRLEIGFVKRVIEC